MLKKCVKTLNKPVNMILMLLLLTFLLLEK